MAARPGSFTALTWGTGWIREQKESEQLTWFVSREEREEGRGEKRQKGIQKCKEDNERDENQCRLFVAESFEERSLGSNCYTTWDILFYCIWDAIIHRVHHYCTYWWNIHLKEKEVGKGFLLPSLHCIKRLFETQNYNLFLALFNALLERCLGFCFRFCFVLGGGFSACF